MKAVEISAFGAPEVLRIADRPIPEPGERELLVKVAAAGVNRPDVRQRQGRYPPPPGVTDIPGLEIAGTVARCGPGVARWSVGDTLCALVAGGGYAEYCVVPDLQCLPVPAGLTMIQAAALPETSFTVWTNVFERGRLRAGESLLVHGGSSGIGTTAIQFAKARDSQVFATAGSDAKCAACERLGAELAVNYRTHDWVSELQSRTEGRGVDVILDMVGGDYVPRNLELLARDGRLVQIAFLGGPKADVDLMRVMTKRLTLTGSTLRPRSAEEKGLIARELHAHIWPLLERGVVHPVVHAVFPLNRAADAHRLMEQGDHIGKIVLTVG
ncbi:MAG: NAD(P)H-quinone oxidoreductase [Acidobacteria bacterium]|nr:NAD(P)H-quinone oxidoreductase [Acidobacteriota bacterium]